MPSSLFPDLPVAEPGPEAPAPVFTGTPRILRPERKHPRLRALALDQLLPGDHQARVVWAYVEQLDLSKLDAAVRAVEGRAGRPSIDRRMLLGLWLFATLDGVGSAREIERLCSEHLAYMWLCGDVGVGRAILAEFRVGHETLLDELLAKSAGTLLAEGLVTLDRVAQDGLRVRASAGAGSFRRRDRLASALEDARGQVAALKAELDADPAAADRRRAAAQLRGAKDRERRLAEAIAQMPAIERTWERNHGRASKRGPGKRKATPTDKDSAGAEAEAGPRPSIQPAVPAEEPQDAGTTAPSPTESSVSPAVESADTTAARHAPRASSTDPDARVMKMSNNGFRPAVNCQLATDVDTLVIVGVGLTDVGSDQGLQTEMLAHVERTLGVRPKEWLLDGGYPSHASVDAMPDDCLLIAPVPTPRDPGRNRFVPLPSDTPKVAAWRKRMGTPEAKETYKQRGASIECVNAHVRNRGLRQMPVRGHRRCRSVLLLHALAHNLLRAVALRRQRSAQGEVFAA